MKRQTIPLPVVLFVIFITFAGLWGMPTNVHAATYTNWSGWSTQYPESKEGREIGSRRVIASYNLIAYYTQENQSPYYRTIREYSINGNYNGYGARPSYGEFLHTGLVPASYIDEADRYYNGSYIVNGGKSAFHRGNGTAYLLKNLYLETNTDQGPWFIASANEVTEYRYRDLKTVVTISYHANGGVNTPDPITVTAYGTQTVTVNLSTKIPTREGYDFLGWSASSSATSAEYQPGSVFHARSSATLFAVWKKKTIPNPQQTENNTPPVNNTPTGNNTPPKPSDKKTTNPVVPKIKTAKCVSGGIYITWTQVKGVTGYYVWRDGKVIATVKGASKCKYTDQKARKNGKAYQYCIQPYTKSGNTVKKGKKSSVKIVIYIVVKLSPSSPSIGSNSIQVKWKKNKKCTGYEIWYSTDKSFKKHGTICVKGPGKTSATLTGLSGGITYYIKIRCYVIYKKAWYYSPFCSAIHVKTKTPSYQWRGCITDAKNGNPIKNAKVIIRSGKGKKNGTVYKTCKTDNSGHYKAKLPKGYYTLEIRKSKYVTIYIVIYVYVNCKNYASNTTSISAPLKAEQYRIVLTWGSKPKDLDSHLTGPSNASGGKFHVYYHSKSWFYGIEKIADLDIDDTTSYGPETVTVNLKIRKNGTYNYYVHDYTNRESSSSNALGKSGARVIVYRGKKQIAVYNVPQKSGTLWHVFSIENGKLIKKNKVSYSSDSSAMK